MLNFALGVLGTLIAAALIGAWNGLFAPIRLPKWRQRAAASDPNRPWLQTIERGVEPSTNRIRIVVANIGHTPAYDVKIEDWCEISREIPEGGVALRVRRYWWQFWLPSAKWLETNMFEGMFEVQYSSRDTRQNAMSVSTLLPGAQVEYLLNDWANELIEQLGIKGSRQVRWVGRVTYTDRSGDLRPDFAFGYQDFRISHNGAIRRFIYECLDPRMNRSR